MFVPSTNITWRRCHQIATSTHEHLCFSQQQCFVLRANKIHKKILFPKKDTKYVPYSTHHNKIWRRMGIHLSFRFSVFFRIFLPFILHHQHNCAHRFDSYFVCTFWLCCAVWLLRTGPAVSPWVRMLFVRYRAIQDTCVSSQCVAR